MNESQHPVNSLQWWDECFAEHSTTALARESADCLVENLLRQLQAPERLYLQSHPISILGWGCGVGGIVDSIGCKMEP